MSEHKTERRRSRGVRDRYAAAARRSRHAAAAPGSSCCGTHSGRPRPSEYRLGSAIAKRNSQLAPEGPTWVWAAATPRRSPALKPGEVVLDLGAGAGFDCFLAARAVGPTGRVIGVDMTPEMVAKARENAREAGYDERRLPPGRDRAPAGRRRIRGRHHLQLRDQPVARQTGRLPRGLPGAQAGRPAGGERRGGHGRTAARMAGRHASALGLHLGRGGQWTRWQAMLRTAGFVDIDIRPKEESREFIREWEPETKLEDYVLSAA